MKLGTNLTSKRYHEQGHIAISVKCEILYCCESGVATTEALTKLHSKLNLRHGYRPYLKHLMSLPALRRPGPNTRDLLLPSPGPPHPPLYPPLFLQNRKNTPVTQTATDRSTTRLPRDGANPGIRLGIFLEVIRVEAVPLQESPLLPRRLRRRRRRALRSRGGGHRETERREA